MSISATLEYYGFCWKGNGRRWDDYAGHLFAYAHKDMTLGDVIDQWVDDFMGGGECDEIDTTEEEMREALASICNGDLSEIFEPTRDIEDDSDSDDCDCASPIIVVLIEQDTE